MAFTVQDDTGLIAGANAYIDVAYLEAYWTDRNVDLSGQSTEAKEAAIIQATSYIDQRYTYKGYKLNGYSQTTEFPREYLYVYQGTSKEPVEGIPREVKDACCEYAKRVIDGTTLQQDANPDGSIKKIKEKIDVIETDIEYCGCGSSGGFIAYPTADNLLKDFTNQASQGSYIRQ